MKTGQYKEFTIQPTTGPLDLTSTPDEVPYGGYRWSENFTVNPQDKKLARMAGYQKLLSADVYSNADLHDQMLSETPGAVRQHLTFGFEAITPSGFTKLYVGTQNRLFSKDNENDGWTLIWDGFGGEPESGCSEIILQAANVNSTVLFSNDFDEPVYHIIDQPPNADGQSVQPIPDFQTLNITRVGFLYAWNNLVIAANVVIDGVRQSGLVLWSDYKRPISFVPGNSSLAGRKFLAYGEIVLNAAPMSDALMLYTNMGIWEVRVSEAVDADGNPQVLSFTKRYSADKAGSRCLKYRRTLVTTGDVHYYAGQDGLYTYSFYTPRPEVEEWARRAASWLFVEERINSGRCAIHCAGYDATRKRMMFSYAKDGETCPMETLAINTETHFSSIIREGASFYMTFDPKRLQSIRNFAIDNCICSPDEIDALDESKTGALCVVPFEPECASAPTHYISDQAHEFHGITTEDWTVADPLPTSLRKQLEGVLFIEDCGDEYTAGKCKTSTLFIFASTVDKCLKQMTNVYYREVCTGFEACGTYEKRGYKSILRSGPNNLREPSANKTWCRFALEADAELALVPGTIHLRIGVASTAVDPNLSKCPIFWHTAVDPDTELPFRLVCRTDKTQAQHEDDGTRNDEELEWPLLLTGKHHYFEITIDNPDSSPIDVGAPVVISRISFNARLEADNCLT